MLKRTSTIILILFFSVTAFSQVLTSVFIDNNQFEISKLETGKIYCKIQVSADTTQSYSLYLPKKFNNTTYFPVIVFFDPDGNGQVPLDLYKDLAEKNDFILAASNSSRNGLIMSVNKKIADNLVDEVKNKFHPNLNKLAFAGFSGGAKVALLVASERDDTKYCFYIGATIPLQSVTHPFPFMGFAGLRDMNYIDLINFDDALGNSRVLHILMETTNKHEWTTPDFFSDAFLFMKKDTILGKYISIEDTIRKHAAEEQTLRESLVKAVYNETEAWWKTKIAELKAPNKNEKVQLLNERLAGFASLFSYTATLNALHMNSLGRVESLLPVYKAVDPQNPDQPILKAAFYVLKNENSKAIEALKEAEKLGLKEKAKLTSEPIFDKLKENKEYQEILTRLK